jgi:hypothetical protein
MHVGKAEQDWYESGGIAGALLDYALTGVTATPRLL